MTTPQCDILTISLWICTCYYSWPKKSCQGLCQVLLHSPPLPPAPHFHPLEDNESNTLPSPCTRHRPAVEGKRNVISIPGLFMNPQSTQQCLKNAGVVSSLDIIKRHAEMQFDFREFRRHKGCQFNDNCISSSYS